MITRLSTIMNNRTILLLSPPGYLCHKRPSAKRVGQQVQTSQGRRCFGTMDEFILEHNNGPKTPLRSLFNVPLTLRILVRSNG